MTTLPTWSGPGLSISRRTGKEKNTTFWTPQYLFNKLVIQKAMASGNTKQICWSDRWGNMRETSVSKVVFQRNLHYKEVYFFLFQPRKKRCVHSWLDVVVKTGENESIKCCASYSKTTVAPRASKAFFNFSASSLGTLSLTTFGTLSTNFLAYKLRKC